MIISLGYLIQILLQNPFEYVKIIPFVLLLIVTLIFRQYMGF